MAWLIVLGILLLLILSFLIFKIGVVVEYSEDGLMAMFFAGPIKIRIYPSRRKKKKKAKKPKAEKKPHKPEEEIKKGGPIGRFKEIVSILSDISDKLHRRITIDTLTLYYMAAGEDAAASALNFGRASAAAGVILPILENHFRILQKDVRTAVSFTEQKSYIYFKIRLSIAMRLIPYIVIIFGYRYKYMKKQNDKGQSNT